MTEHAPHGESSTPVREHGMAVWTGGTPDDPWTIEIEDDVFDLGEGPVVSLNIDNTRNGRGLESGLATLTPEQARAIAAELVVLAARVEKRRAGS